LGASFAGQYDIALSLEQVDRRVETGSRRVGLAPEQQHLGLVHPVVPPRLDVVGRVGLTNHLFDRFSGQGVFAATREKFGSNY
jgi:hypothetical protein